MSIPAFVALPRFHTLAMDYLEWVFQHEAHVRPSPSSVGLWYVKAVVGDKIRGRYDSEEDMIESLGKCLGSPSITGGWVGPVRVLHDPAEERYIVYRAWRHAGVGK